MMPTTRALLLMVFSITCCTLPRASTGHPGGDSSPDINSVLALIDSAPKQYGPHRNGSFSEPVSYQGNARTPLSPPTDHRRQHTKQLPAAGAWGATDGVKPHSAEHVGLDGVLRITVSQAADYGLVCIPADKLTESAQFISEKVLDTQKDSNTFQRWETLFENTPKDVNGIAECKETCVNKTQDYIPLKTSQNHSVEHYQDKLSSPTSQSGVVFSEMSHESNQLSSPIDISSTVDATSQTYSMEISSIDGSSSTPLVIDGSSSLLPTSGDSPSTASSSEKSPSTTSVSGGSSSVAPASGGSSSIATASEQTSSTSSASKIPSSISTSGGSSSAASASEGSSSAASVSEGSSSSTSASGASSSAASAGEKSSSAASGSDGSSSAASVSGGSSSVAPANGASSSSSSASEQTSSAASENKRPSSVSTSGGSSSAASASDGSSSTASASDGSSSAASASGASSSAASASEESSSAASASDGSSSAASVSGGSSSVAPAIGDTSSSSSASEKTSSAASENKRPSSVSTSGGSSSAASASDGSSSAASASGASSSAASASGESSSAASASEGSSSSASASEESSSSSSTNGASSTTASSNDKSSAAASNVEESSSVTSITGDSSSAASPGEGSSSVASASKGSSSATFASGAHSSAAGSGEEFLSTSAIGGSSSAASASEKSSSATLASDGSSIPVSTIEGLHSASTIHQNTSEYNFSDFKCTCVAYYMCREEDIIADGAHIIDIRFRNNHDKSMSNSKCKSFLDVCCVAPLQRPDPIVINGLIDNDEYSPRCGNRNENGLSVFLEGFKDAETQFAEYPSMGIILESEKVGHKVINKYVCGCSLIHRQVALTAAHCVFRKKVSKLLVRFGDWDTKSERELFPHEQYGVVRVHVHAQFNSKTLFNNVALLLLQTPIQLKRHIDTICLPAPPPSPRESAADAGGDYRAPSVSGGGSRLSLQQLDLSRCVATGFGKRQYHGGAYQNIMKQVQLGVVTRADCQRRLRATRLGRWFLLHRTFLCAGGRRGADTCRGDGGSPLMCPPRHGGGGGGYTQVGIVAWGIGCGEEGVPGVYTSVEEMMPWIDTHTRLLLSQQQ